MTNQPNRRVVAVLYDRLCTFEFGITTELFALPRPELNRDWYRFEAVSIDQGPIRGAGGIVLTASTALDSIEKAGTVVLPGWRDPDERPPDVLLDAIRRAHANGARIMSICSGVFVLAATGLLDGHPATLSWLGSVGRHRVLPLGVTRFGQSGDVQDLYHAYELDVDAILDAAARLCVDAGT